MRLDYTVNVNGEKSFKVSLADEQGRSGTINSKAFSLDTLTLKEGQLHIIDGSQSYNVDIVEADHAAKTFVIMVNGEQFELKAEDQYDELLHSMGLDDLYSNKVNDVKAPMPGKVLEVMVKPGQDIRADEPLLVLEAMKMENVIKSPCDARIKNVSVKKGITVEKNELLVDFE